MTLTLGVFHMMHYMNARYWVILLTYFSDHNTVSIVSYICYAQRVYHIYTFHATLSSSATIQLSFSSWIRTDKRMDGQCNA